VKQKTINLFSDQEEDIEEINPVKKTKQHLISAFTIFANGNYSGTEFKLPSHLQSHLALYNIKTTTTKLKECASKRSTMK